MNFRKVLAIAIILGVFFTGCSYMNKYNLNENKGKIEEQIMDKGPIEGGSINLFSTVPDTLNPLFTTNIYVKDFSSLMFEGLIEVNQNQMLTPALAEKWSVSGDGLVWTFNLRKNVKWSDNTDFTSDDVLFTFNTIINSPKEIIYKKNLDNILSFSAKAKDVFIITLKNPYSLTPWKLNFPIIPKHYYDVPDVAGNSNNMNPLGSGPYKFLTYTNNKIELIENKSWWHLNIDKSNSEEPYISNVHIKVYQDINDITEAFQKKEVDAIDLTKGIWERYIGRRDLTLRKYASNKFDFLAINVNKGFMIDTNFRKAINMAIDKMEIANNTIQGEGIASDMPLMPQSIFNNFDIVSGDSGIEKAKEFLKSVGYVEDNGKIMKNKYGWGPINFELLVNDDNETRIKVSEKIKYQLAQIGIEVNIIKLDFDKMMQRVKLGNYDMALMGLKITSVPDIQQLYTSLEKGGMNVSGLHDASIDEIFTKINQETDVNKLIAYYKELKGNLMNKMPYIGLYFYNDALLVNSKIKGNIIPWNWNKIGGAAKWYIPIG